MATHKSAEKQNRRNLERRGTNRQHRSRMKTEIKKLLKAIENNLVEDSLVYRYCRTNAASDGLGGEEGTFNMCSFWYVENLSRAGDLDKARFVFEKVLSYANHLGLYSEELGPC